MRAIGLGDNVVDMYMHRNVMYPGGNAMNFAVYANLMGVESAYLGVFGSDDAAAHVHDTAQTLGLDMSHCRYEDGENGYSQVDIKEGDRIFTGSNKGGVLREHPVKLSRLDLEYLSGFDVVHTSMFSYVQQELPKLRQWCSFISMDFSDQFSKEHLKTYCPYIDCACLSCSHMEEEEILRLMRDIVDAGCRHIVLATRGNKGAIVMVDGRIYRQSPCLIKAVDTMGAGDSFITRFLVGYCEGMVKTGADQQPLFYLKHMISIKSDGDKGGGTPGIRRDVMEAALFEALQGQIKISAHIMAGMGI